MMIICQAQIKLNKFIYYLFSQLCISNAFFINRFTIYSLVPREEIFTTNPVKEKPDTRGFNMFFPLE